MTLNAFAIRAVSESLSQANPVFLEPVKSVMSVACTVPDAVAGDVSSKLFHPSQRRGIIENIENYPKRPGSGLNS